MAPASAAAMSPSAKGKNASEATMEPLRSRLASPAFQTAIFELSTRDICPAPTPRVRSQPAYTIALDFTCLTTFQPKAMARISSGDGWRLETIFQSLGRSGMVSRSCISTPPTTERISRKESAGKLALTVISRRFFFLPNISRAASVNAGAMITSQNILLMITARSASMVWLTTMIPPKGAC